MKTTLYTLLGVLLLLSCTKEDNAPGENKLPYFFSAVVNGLTLDYEAEDANSRYVCGSSSVYTTVDDEYDVYEGTYIGDGEDRTRNRIYVHILQRFPTYQLTQDQRLSLFRVGSYEYGKQSEYGEPTQNGATVRYTDEHGVAWDSEGGPQAGSTFVITEIGDDPLITSAKIFKAKFSCKLYAWDGSSQQVTDGKICGRIVSP